MEATTKGTEGTEKTTKKVAKKGNKTTELIIGSAASKLTSALSNLHTAVEEAKKLEQVVGDTTLKVVDLEDKIGALEQDLINKKAQNKFELELSYNSDRQSFVGLYLKENDLTTVKKSEWLEMQKNLENAESIKEAAIKKEVAVATNSLTASHNSALKVAQLEHEKKEAENAASIKQLTAQITFLNQQNINLQNLLDKQIQAETERSKHGAINTLNVGGTTQGR